MKVLSFICLLLCLCSVTNAQKPKNGTYTYTMAFAEHMGHSMGESCIVIIKGDSIKVIYDGKGKLTAKKGEVLDEGIIMKHTKTGKWIIARSADDKNAPEVGGCTDGPSVIDFRRKKYWTC